MFGSLPPPSKELSKRDADDLNELSSGEDEPGYDSADEPVAQHRPAKRARAADEPEPAPAPSNVRALQEPANAAQPAAASAAAAPTAAQNDQVVAALHKITAHISSASKFAKACPLLRQLLDGDKIATRAQQRAAFETLKAAFANPDNASEPGLRKEYARLLASVERCQTTGGAASGAGALFTRASEREQIEIYRLWALLRSELQTDDGFVFSKVVTRVKDAIAALPEADESDDATYSRVFEGDAAAPSAPAQQPPAAAAAPAMVQAKAAPPAPAAAAPAAPKEEDPFGLGALMGGADGGSDDPFGLNALMGGSGNDGAAAGAPAPKPKPPKEPAEGQAWAPDEALCQRRRALLGCVATARGMHRLAWARTTVELLIDFLGEHR